MTALSYGEKKKKNKKKKHTLSHRKLVNLSELYYKTNFVSLRETFLCLCRCKYIAS